MNKIHQTLAVGLFFCPALANAESFVLYCNAEKYFGEEFTGETNFYTIFKITVNKGKFKYGEITTLEGVSYCSDERNLQYWEINTKYIHTWCENEYNNIIHRYSWRINRFTGQYSFVEININSFEERRISFSGKCVRLSKN